MALGNDEPPTAVWKNTKGGALGPARTGSGGVLLACVLTVSQVVEGDVLTLLHPPPPPLPTSVSSTGSGMMLSQDRQPGELPA